MKMDRNAISMRFHPTSIATRQPSPSLHPTIYRDNHCLLRINAIELGRACEDKALFGGVAGALLQHSQHIYSLVSV